MNADEKDASLREHLLYLLRGGGAHIGFDDAVKDFPVAHINRMAAGTTYTPWQLLEHMRIAQWDILEFSRSATHVSPDWPEGYWPDKSFEADEADWHKSVEAFRRDLSAVEELIENTSTDLYARIPHGDGQTILREALLIADHNAYHTGVLVTIRRALEASGDGAQSTSG